MSDFTLITANPAIRERLQSRMQARAKRCESVLFDRCHRDAGHWGAHVSYAEKGEGLSGWRNEAPEGNVDAVEHARAILRWAEDHA